MLRATGILSFAFALTCLGLVTTAHAQSPGPNQSPAIAAPPLTCTNSTGTVRIEAQTDALGNFPVPVACPENTLGAVDCFQWSYKYTLLSGNNISLSAVTVDSDLDIVAATGGTPETGSGMKVYAPGESDSGIGQIGANAFDFRTVRFASQGTVVLGNVYTRRNAGIGSVTAISKVGNQGPSTCQIAGADNFIEGTSVGVAPVTTTQIDQFQECTITLALDPKGCPTDVHASSSNPAVTCTVSEITQPTIDGQPFLGGQCRLGTALATQGSTCIWYCPTSYGTCFKVCK